jgi:hypothetical protein
MPTAMKLGAYRFHFYSDEGREPVHIHVETPDGECKFLLDPIRLAGNKGVSPEVIPTASMGKKGTDLFSCYP